MPVALITGAARAEGIAAGIAPRLTADGWDVATSDLADVDYPCDLSTPSGPQELIDPVAADRGPISALVLSHAHDVETGILDTTAESEFGPRGISANVLNPGPVDTGWMDEATRLALTAHHPLGRLGTPADIAGVVSFLVSRDGRWVSGQLLHADGGFSARF